MCSLKLIIIIIMIYNYIDIVIIECNLSIFVSVLYYGIFYELLFLQELSLILLYFPIAIAFV